MKTSKFIKNLIFICIIVLFSVQLYDLRRTNSMLNEQIEVVTGMLLDLDEDLHEIHDILEVDEK